MHCNVNGNKEKETERNTAGTIAHWCVFMSEYPQQGGEKSIYIAQ